MSISWKLLAITALTVAPLSSADAEQLIGLTLDQRIVSFDSATPTLIESSFAVSGLASGDVLSGIDLRSSNGILYGVAAASGRIYSLTTSGLATLVSTSSIVPTGGILGVDFNPVPDRLRIIGADDQNLRINVDTGAAIADTGITKSGGGSIDIVGSAYTNSVPNAPAPLTTMLFGIDSITDSLVFSAAPNGGVYTNVGSLGVQLTNLNQVGFDISGRTGAAFLNIDSALYSINLGTGATTFINTIGSGPLVGLTASGAVPEPSTWAMLVMGFGITGYAMRAKTRRKVPSFI
ncbi:DUF4394 domain-containing protein [Sphingobium boeckii]|uniref:PEP-CTERM protein-sorting domain-containing protein n=1 Tax=Sphingobium boeckii TaxID=1082345 RepID=A0A7W9EG12_9SPHN|nr:DUF4394 domain-containing protein [Sphingobium boeckii]MBB5687842.1 hypothetical protein [Sphingobium boeckii]